MQQQTDIEEVGITFPAKPGYLGLCRLNATSMAGMLGFDIDTLDEIRLAVSESVSWLLAEPGTDAAVTVTIAAAESHFSFSAALRPGGSAPGELDDLAAAILGATVDTFDSAVDGDARTISFTKSPAPTL